MQKCHINSALGRGKPFFPKCQRLEYTSISLRRLHGSHLLGQERDSQAHTNPFPRRGRGPDTNQEINKLLETSESRPRVPQPTRPLIQRIAVDRKPAPQQPYQYRSAPSGAIDTRSLGARPPAAFSQPGRAPLQNRWDPQRQRASRFGGSGRRSAREGDRQQPTENSYGKKKLEVQQEPEPDEVTAYLEEIRLRGKPRSVIYEPAEMTAESLHGTGPALAMGEWGMSEVVRERLARIDAKRDEWAARREAQVRKKFAEKYTGPVADQWRVVTERVDRLHERRMNSQRGTEGEKEGAHALTEEQKARFVNRLLGGQYVMGGKGDGGVLDHVDMLTCRNGSYFPRDGESVVKKVGTLLGPRKVGERVRA